MSRQRHVLKGAKINNSHSTVIEAAQPYVVAAKRQPEVTRVVISVIKTAPGGRTHVKITRVPAGLRVQVRGPQSVQLLWVYTSDPERTEAALRRVAA